jgi:hypothetical protein
MSITLAIATRAEYEALLAPHRTQIGVSMEKIRETTSAVM